ncbi:MAG TPA: uroporphyrinogen decarboxylase, partial [Gammaproteobacteria bacterium]|nr:uroporphyrinogen decarboxylase [Gammaproteobacteria bacterium]
MSDLQNDLLIRALLRQPVERTPVWMMRQAGRYLPEYRETRAKAGSFLKLMMNPELACEVTLQPLARFPLDAAILFSDILTIPQAMGLGLYFAEGEGPKFERPIRDAASVKQLGIPDPETDTRFVMDAISLIRRELDGKVPLIGFAGSPWTIATYMVEGGGSKNFSRVKGMLYEQPQTLHALLEKLAESITLYLTAQIANGAQTIMLFDTWGGVLTPQAYQDFSLQYMARIVQNLPKQANGQRVPVIFFTKGGGNWLDVMADTGVDALGVDWTMNMDEARRRVGDKVALQGNLDPNVLYAQPEEIRAEVAKVL